ncbi:MAG: hypothetical protein GKS03_12065 [Alphaproteobacteria bacterium]|nr:hypothetical protein [Alphaproteobacteria bacterium]
MNGELVDPRQQDQYHEDNFVLRVVDNTLVGKLSSRGITATDVEFTKVPTP